MESVLALVGKFLKSRFTIVVFSLFLLITFLLVFDNKTKVSAQSLSEFQPPQITSTNTTIDENVGIGHFIFTLSPTSTATVSASFNTSDGTASDPADYIGTQKGTLTFQPGQSEATIDIPIIDDSIVEPDETFFINVFQPFCDCNSPSSWTETIHDNDALTPTPIPPTNIPPTGVPGPTATPGPGPTATPGPGPTSMPGPTPTSSAPPESLTPPPFTSFIEPTDEPSPTTEPEPTSIPETKGASTQKQSDRSAFVLSVLAPNEIPFTIENVGRSLFLTGFLILLILFPSEIFNSTVQSNYDEIIHWFWIEKLQQFFKGLQDMPHLVMVFIYAVISAFISSLLSPDWGFNKATFSLIVGMLIALAAGSTIYDVSRAFYMKKKFGYRSKLRAHSFGLLTGAILVLVSRLANFLPGYCYGLFTGLVFRTEPKDHEVGEGLAIASVILIVVALTAWITWIPIKAVANSGNPSFLVLIVDAAFASFWVSTLTALVFGLLPLRFMYGEQLKKWSGWSWLAIYATGVFLYIFTLINPAVGIYGKSSKVSLVSVLILFIAFGGFSMSFWGYFRYRHLWGGGPKKK